MFTGGQISAPVLMSWATTGEPLGSPPGGKPVCRTMNTALPSITGCQAMMDGREPDHLTVAMVGPTALVMPLREALPPELVQSALVAHANASARNPADHRKNTTRR